MTIDFFEKEVEKMQARFNQTFGHHVVCSLKARQEVILAVIYLETLCRKIRKINRTDQARGEIQKFIRVRNTLNNIFKMFDHPAGERSKHAGKTNWRIEDNEKWIQGK